MFGTTCNGNAIIRLELSHNNLEGSIPQDFHLLSDLRVLELSNNRLTGTLPTGLGSLSSLTIFSVSSNRLFGDIPTELSQLTLLTVFDVSDNYFTGGDLSGMLTSLSSLTSFSCDSTCVHFHACASRKAMCGNE
jgi:Leucine-rich repeat (LRR) protein